MIALREELSESAMLERNINHERVERKAGERNE